jgi:hypothetical protein
MADTVDMLAEVAARHDRPLSHLFEQTVGFLTPRT